MRVCRNLRKFDRVDHILPHFARLLAPGPRATLPDRLDGTAHADEERLKAHEPARAVLENPVSPRVGVVEAGVDDDVEAEPGMDSDRLEERGVEHRHARLDLWWELVRTRPESNAGLPVGWRARFVRVKAEVHPNTGHRFLDFVGERRFAGARDAV